MFADIYMDSASIHVQVHTDVPIHDILLYHATDINVQPMQQFLFMSFSIHGHNIHNNYYYHLDMPVLTLGEPLPPRHTYTVDHAESEAEALAHPSSPLVRVALGCGLRLGRTCGRAQ